MSSAAINSKLEFTICKEAASIAVTAGELIAIYESLCREIENPAFVNRLNVITGYLQACYRIPLDALQPFLALQDMQSFNAQFDSVCSDYKEQYLNYASQPRPLVDAAYEQYLELSMSREASTTYPVLKRSFDRLFQLIDKWINNDSWLIMSMDGLFKMLYRLTVEIAAMKTKDVDEAWWMYHSLFDHLRPFLTIIDGHAATLGMLAGQREEDKGAAA